jgi:hypothetical protein
MSCQRTARYESKYHLDASVRRANYQPGWALKSPKQTRLLGESPIVSVEAEAEVEASNNILERGSEEFHREQDNSLSLDDVDADSVTEDEEGSVYSPCLSHQYYHQYQD